MGLTLQYAQEKCALYPFLSIIEVKLNKFFPTKNGLVSSEIGNCVSFGHISTSNVSFLTNNYYSMTNILH